MRDDLAEFNKNFVGAGSVFPIKNGAPRILTQFRENPYVLELQDQYTTGNKPKKLPTIGTELVTTKVSQQQGGYWNTSYAQLQ